MIQNLLKELNEKSDKTIEVLKSNLQTIRTGRANPHILDKVTVSYYGTETPLNQLSNISAPEPRLLQINPYDISIINDIEKAIQIAGLGVNPSNDGKIIRIAMPMLTEERRIELTKQAKSLGEDSKIAIRNSRRDYIDKVKKMEKDSLISKDELSRIEKDIQDVIDKCVKQIDTIIAKKESDILEV